MILKSLPADLIRGRKAVFGNLVGAVTGNEWDWRRCWLAMRRHWPRKLIG